MAPNTQNKPDFKIFAELDKKLAHDMRDYYAEQGQHQGFKDACEALADIAVKSFLASDDDAYAIREALTKLWRKTPPHPNNYPREHWRTHAPVTEKTDD